MEQYSDEKKAIMQEEAYLEFLLEREKNHAGDFNSEAVILQEYKVKDMVADLVGGSDVIHSDPTR